MSRNDIAFFVLPREVAYLIQHILNKYAVALGGVVYRDVSHRSNELSVLDNWRAAHECGQEGTTHFYNYLTVSTLFVKKKLLYCSI